MASFDENGKYIKTNWKAGDKIAATKLNKIEESIEAVNDNDISRHVEADARLDALEAKDVAHDKEFTNVRNLIADNKAAAELGDYEINSRMQFLEQELNEGIEEVHNVASTVDGKIAQAVTNVNDVASTVDGKIAQAVTNVNDIANTVDGKISQVEVDMQNQVNQCKADIEAMVAEVEDEFDKHTHDEYLPLSGGSMTGTLTPNTEGLNLGSDTSRWNMLYLGHRISIANADSEIFVAGYGVACTKTHLYLRGGSDDRGVIVEGEVPTLRPDGNNVWDLGGSDKRWKTLYCMNNLNVSSDRSLKENIEYVGKANSGLTYEDMYNFVKDDLGLATYNFIGDDNLRMNFIAQDLLVNTDGTDNKVGQMIVNPVAVPSEQEITEGKPYPTLSYDSGMYTSVLAGALKEAINRIEQLEARVNELENK